MKIEIVAGHSVATDLLTKGPVLDAGSRGLIMAKHLAGQGHQVIALDPGEDETAEGVIVHKKALVHSSLAGKGNLRLVPTEDPEGRYIQSEGGNTYGVSISALMQEYKIKQWDLVKLNIEGSEYDILDEWPGPIARQIVFSFHEHTQAARGKAECDRIINKLRTWYDIHNQVWEKRHFLPSDNYWDVLAIERGIDA